MSCFFTLSGEGPDQVSGSQWSGSDQLWRLPPGNHCNQQWRWVMRFYFPVMQVTCLNGFPSNVLSCVLLLCTFWPAVEDSVFYIEWSEKPTYSKKYADIETLLHGELLRPDAGILSVCSTRCVCVCVRTFIFLYFPLANLPLTQFCCKMKNLPRQQILTPTFSLQRLAQSLPIPHGTQIMLSTQYVHIHRLAEGF